MDFLEIWPYFGNSINMLQGYITCYKNDPECGDIYLLKEK